VEIDGRDRFVRRRPNLPTFDPDLHAMNITVPLTVEQAERLNQLAESLGVDPAELARAACVDVVSQPPNDFRKAAGHVLEKNRELYRRLS